MGGVGGECEAECLNGLVVVVTPLDVALVGEEDVAAQGVEAFSLVELSANPSPEFFVGQVTAQVDGAHEAPVFVQCTGEAVLSLVGVQFGDDQAGGGVPELHRRDESEQVVPNDR